MSLESKKAGKERGWFFASFLDAREPAPCFLMNSETQTEDLQLGPLFYVDYQQYDLTIWHLSNIMGQNHLCTFLYTLQESTLSASHEV